MKRTAIISVVILLIALFVAVFAYINQEKLIERYIQHLADQTALRYDLLEIDPEEPIKVITVGTAAPLLTERAQSCTAVIAGDQFLLFDLGEGTISKMENIRLPIQEVDAVFISHWHTDHYIDLPGFVNRSWLFGRKEPLGLYGPPGALAIANGIDSLLHLDKIYRIEHHGPTVLEMEASRLITHEILSEESVALIYDHGGVKVEALQVTHHPVDVSLAYRVTYAGHTVVLSGDTSYDERLISFAQGADILLHEAMNKELIDRVKAYQIKEGNDRQAKILGDILDYHTTPKGAAQIAAAANVKKLILNHLAPVPENPISRRVFVSGLDGIYDGPILLAEDGDLYTVKK